MDWGEVAIIAGITVLSTGICLICPPATPWVIAGGVAAGAIAEGGLEVYRESKTGEYDWRKILIKTLGGSLKGALAASPLKPLATGIGVGATGAIEDYLYCLTCGETHEQAIRSAAINGPIEGVTTGGLKFIGNAVANKVKARKVTKLVASTERSTLKPNLQLFAKKGREIVGTEFSEIKPTQSVINRERVDFYKAKLQIGQKIKPIEVCDVEGKGTFIVEGHHRFVASKETGIPVDIIRTKAGGPTGFPSWKYVEWKKYVSEEQFWGE